MVYVKVNYNNKILINVLFKIVLSLCCCDLFVFYVDDVLLWDKYL